jgi:hypothetical protein
VGAAAARAGEAIRPVGGGLRRGDHGGDARGGLRGVPDARMPGAGVVGVPGMRLGEGRDHDEKRRDPKDRSEPSQKVPGLSHRA